MSINLGRVRWKLDAGKATTPTTCHAPWELRLQGPAALHVVDAHRLMSNLNKDSAASGQTV